MKRSLPFVLVLLGLGIVLLVLNLREADDYEFGALTPPAKGSNVSSDDFAFQRVFPEFKFTHACAGCGECVHPFEVLENRRTMSMVDHDGWYKVFWAADEKYYYTDPIHMLADWSRNRTAENPVGTWKIRLRAGSATHARRRPATAARSPRMRCHELVSTEIRWKRGFHSGDGPMK
jgi:hypothetical protein